MADVVVLVRCVVLKKKRLLRCDIVRGDVFVRRVKKKGVLKTMRLMIGMLRELDNQGMTKFSHDRHPDTHK